MDYCGRCGRTTNLITFQDTGGLYNEIPLGPHTRMTAMLQDLYMHMIMEQINTPLLLSTRFEKTGDEE